MLRQNDSFAYRPQVKRGLIHSYEFGVKSIGSQVSDISKVSFSEDYENNANFKKYGFLYNWAAAMVSAPAGFHLPTDDEWFALEDYLKDEGESCVADRSGVWDCDSAGSKLKEGGSSGFEGLLAGYRYTNGSFYNLSSSAYLWSSSQYSSTTAWRRYLDSSATTVGRYASSKEYGFSVRCLKDSSSEDPDGTIGSFIDERDGREYSTVVVNGQVWMSENLKYLGGDIRLVDSFDSSGPCAYIYDLQDSNYGTITGATRQKNEKIIQPELSFDGVNDEVNFGDIGDFGTDDFTISITANVVKYNDIGSSFNALFCQGGLSSSLSDFFGLFIDVNNKIRFIAFISTFSILSSDSINDGYHHFVIKRSGDVFSFYIDNVLVGSDTHSGSLGETDDLFVCRDSASTRFSESSVANFKIFDVALTDSEINNLYFENSRYLGTAPINFKST